MGASEKISESESGEEVGGLIDELILIPTVQLTRINHSQLIVLCFCSLPILTTYLCKY